MSNEMKNLTIGSTTWEVVDSTARSDISNLSSRIDNLPEPMVFRGSLGTGGTITSLPVDGSASIGDTYKVITDGIYASQSAKVGDTFICDSETSGANTWVLIPSGDEPSGTVTSITLQATSPIVVDSSSAITTSGTRTISHADSGVTAGTYTSVTVDAKGHVTAGSNPPQPAATTFYDNTSSELSATNVQDALDEVVDDLDDKADRVPLPADYDATSTYAVGDFCTYNGDAYVCVTTISTPEAWNSSHWILDSQQDYLHSINPSGIGSFSLNRRNGTTIGILSFAAGRNGTASGDYSHAEGDGANAIGMSSHAEGISTTASREGAHAEGAGTTASNIDAHAEGGRTTASGVASHAEGFCTIARGDHSHAEGYYTTAKFAHQHVFGEYNVVDPASTPINYRGNYVEIVGNGTADDARSNARTLDWDGNEVLAGSLTATQINGTLPYDNTSSGLSATNVQNAIDEVLGNIPTSTAGSATQPCYFNSGTPTACTYSLNKTVPSDAVFTDNNTTYTFAGGTNKFTVTPSGGTAQDVTITPSITNNITGSGTANYIPKFTAANTIGNGFGTTTSVTSGSDSLVTSGGVYSAFTSRIKRTSSSRYFTSSNSAMTYTKLSLSCPSGHMYIVQAWFRYVNGAPRIVGACHSSTAWVFYDVVAASGDSGTINAGGSSLTFMMYPGETIYYWALYYNATQNYISENILDITL